MPKGRTKTSLYHTRGLILPPEICISKPPGNGCVIYVWTCVGTYCGYVAYPFTNLADCEAIAQGMEEKTVKMIYYAPAQSLFQTSIFNNCTPTPEYWEIEACGIICGACAPAGCIGPGVIFFVTEPIPVSSHHWACPLCPATEITCADGFIWMAGDGHPVEISPPSLIITHHTGMPPLPPIH